MSSPTKHRGALDLVVEVGDSIQLNRGKTFQKCEMSQVFSSFNHKRKGSIYAQLDFIKWLTLLVSVSFLYHCEKTVGYHSKQKVFVLNSANFQIHHENQSKCCLLGSFRINVWSVWRNEFKSFRISLSCSWTQNEITKDLQRFAIRALGTSGFRLSVDDYCRVIANA